MPSLSFTKKQVARVVEVLDQDYDSIEDAAMAVLEEAQAIHQERAQWIVLGQVRYRNGEGYFDPEDERAEKVAVAWYATESQARNGAASLTASTATHEEMRVWVMPVEHGSPAELYAKRKAKMGEADEAKRSKFHKELQRRIDWVAENPGKELPDDMRGPIPFR